MQRLVWYLKQLLPRTYWSLGDHYRPGELAGRRVFTVWRMWLGRCYDVVQVEMGPAEAAR